MNIKNLKKKIKEKKIYLLYSMIFFAWFFLSALIGGFGLIRGAAALILQVPHILGMPWSRLLTNLIRPIHPYYKALPTYFSDTSTFGPVNMFFMLMPMFINIFIIVTVLYFILSSIQKKFNFSKKQITFMFGGLIIVVLAIKNSDTLLEPIKYIKYTSSSLSNDKDIPKYPLNPDFPGVDKNENKVFDKLEVQLADKLSIYPEEIKSHLKAYGLKMLEIQSKIFLKKDLSVHERID